MKRIFLLGIDRFLAGKFWKQLSIAIIPFTLVLFIIAFFYTFHFNGPKTGPYYENIHKAFIDMTNSDTVSSKLDDPTKGFWPVFGFAFVYFLGATVFSGLLIATITNIWRARADKFRRGAVKYKFKNHIVFIGYNSLIAGMIQKICEEEDVRIVVGVENGASTVSDKIKNRLFKEYRKRVVVLQADSCNMEDLERLRVPYAKEVFIIGEHDDAYNLKCYRTIYELSLCENSKKARMPQCYVNLHSQATLTLFRTYASAGDLGIDFTKFHSFSFYDEWAKYMIKEHCKCNKNRQVHFIIAGMTEMGIALAQKVALLCHNPNDNKPSIITLIDDDACKKAKLFIIQHQEFFNRCTYRIKTKKSMFLPQKEKSKLLDIEFEFIEGNLTDDKIRHMVCNSIGFKQQTTTIALCYEDPQQNLTMGLTLPDIVYEEKRDAHVWVYQPTLGDLGKYLKNSCLKNVVTFGMLGEDLDIRNEKNIFRAKLINHFICQQKVHDKNITPLDKIDYSNYYLINTEWDEANISKRWACIRRAEYIPFLANYNTNDIEMVDLESKRASIDNVLFPILEITNDLHHFQCDNYKYINALKQDIASDDFSFYKSN